MITPNRTQERRLNEIETAAGPRPETGALGTGPETSLRTAAFLIVLLWGVSAGREFLEPLCIAALLAFLIAPIERLLNRRLHVPSAVSLSVATIAVLSPLFFIGYFLFRQGEGFVHDFPRLMATGRVQLAQLGTHPWAQRLGIGPDLQLQSVFEKVSAGLGQGLGVVVGGLAAVAGVGSQAVLIFTFSILMVASRQHLRRSAERLAARSQSLRGARLVDRATDLIQQFLVARILIVGIVGALSALALRVLGVHYSAFLGVGVGVATLVPAVGFLVALAVNLVAAFIQGDSFGSVAAIAIALLVINCIENYVLTPKLVGNRLKLSALASFVGLFGGGLIWGVWGMFLSIPILGVMRIAFSAVPSLQPWASLMADEEPADAAPAVPEAEVRSSDQSAA